MSDRIRGAGELAEEGTPTMPLDLNALSGQLPLLAEYARRQSPRQADRLATALAALREHATDSSLVERALGARHHPFRAAVPLDLLDRVAPCPPCPAAYTVAATDGSQIEPDRHGPVLCHLMNVGSALIEYGPDPRAQLESRSHLAFTDEEVFYHLPGREPILIEDRLLGLKRHLAETARLAELASASSADRPRLALLDGTLLLSAWGQGSEREILEPMLDQFLSTLDTMRLSGVPVASYISRPRGSDVVNLLRLAICPWPNADCRTSGCSDMPSSETPCGGIAGLPDAVVYSRIITGAGERSGVFQSSWAASRDHYREHKIHFFYLNVGREIARVEVPEWVAVDSHSLDLIQAILIDQCARGDGYPRVLMEAHEKAVVTEGDRRMYEVLLERTLVGEGIRFEPSAKERSKRIRSI